MERDVVLEKYEKMKSFLQESENLNEEQKKCLRGLFQYLETMTHWMTQQCSTRFHNSFEGGLLEHSVNVVNTALKMKRSIASDIRDEDVIICALLHDCGKSDMYIQKEPTERQRQYGYPGSTVVDESIPYMEHEDRSLWMITRFYPYLTEEMFCAIAQHNEPWLTSTSQFKKSRLMTLIQNSDYWVCNYVDKPGEKG